LPKPREPTTAPGWIWQRRPEPHAAMDMHARFQPRAPAPSTAPAPTMHAGPM
jgi:hypothetical protein